MSPLMYILLFALLPFPILVLVVAWERVKHTRIKTGAEWSG